MPFQLYVDSLYTSPYALSAFVALTEKGLPFSVKTVDLEGGEQRLAGYADRALTGRVPALVEGDFVLTESSAITEYLEESFPAPEYVRAVSRRPSPARAGTADSGLGAQRPAAGPHGARHGNRVLQSLRAADRHRAAGGRQAGARGRHLIQGPQNIFGDWSLADTDLAIMLSRLVRNGDAVPAKLQEYVDFQWQRRRYRLGWPAPAGLKSARV
jgi:glutathione S-transferase